MKLLYVQHARIMGGSVRSLAILIEDAIQAGFQCEVLCPNKEIAEIYKPLGARTTVIFTYPIDHNTAWWYKISLLNIIRIIRMFLFSLWGATLFFYALRRIEPDCVHLNSSVLPLHLLICKFKKVPSIFHVRENIVIGHLGIRRWLLKVWVNALATKVIYISEQEFNLLKTKKSKSCIIYNYVRADFLLGYKQAEIQEVKEIKKFKIISLGGISPIKGTEELIQISNLLGDNVEIHIVGTADPRQKPRLTNYEEKIARLLQSKDPGSNLIKIIPPIKDIRPLVTSSHVLIFWGTVPHFPRPIIEALLLGCPVVCLDSPAIPKILKEFCYDVIKENNIETLASVLLKIKNDNSQYLVARRLSASGYGVLKETFVDNFSSFEDVYKSVLTKNKK